MAAENMVGVQIVYNATSGFNETVEVPASLKYLVI